MARKVILATGRGGFGGPYIPECVKHLPKIYYSHTCEQIDFKHWYGKKIGILGTGASGFDAAAAALECGAAEVSIFARRPNIPSVNKFASTTYSGFSQGFCKLPAHAKAQIMQYVFAQGGPPPFESLDRVSHYPHFQVFTDAQIRDIAVIENQLFLKTNRQSHTCDFLILATGFAIDGRQRPELRAIFDAILLWKDLLTDDFFRSVGNYPYLGEHFQFIEKEPNAASYLRNIYCFNYSAILSHGLTSSDIPDISTGAIRLAKGIAADFFTEQWDGYFQRLQGYVRPEFLAKDYPFSNY